MGLGPLWELRVPLPETVAVPSPEPGDERAAREPEPAFPSVAELDEPAAYLVREEPSVSAAELPQPSAEAPMPGADALGRNAAIAVMDWPQLIDSIRGCTACGLCQTRKQAVPGVGDQQAQWLIVGEAPGADEDRLGEPFVGRAGQLLDNMLAALGLRRGQGVYIANVLKCRPPNNRDPQPDEVAACRAYLQRQIDLIQPQVILCVGRHAANTLLGLDERVGQLRGRVHDLQGIPLVVTYHPAYLLRSPAEKARAWQDLVLARSALVRAG